MGNIKTLEEIAKDYGEERVGVEKEFKPNNGYFIPHIAIFDKSRKNDYTVIDSKVHISYNFKGRNQPDSFGYFKSQYGYNAKLKLTSAGFQNHLGEYLGFIILAQLGKKVCKVDIGTAEIKKKYTGDVLKIPGCLSHLQTKSCESFKSMSEIADEFKQSTATENEYKKLAERGKTCSDANKVNIEIVLAAMESLYRNHQQEKKIPELRKSIFDMCMFDIKFANRDRHDDNFGLKINQRTDELTPYPLFDNEQILGFAIGEKAAERAGNMDSKSYKKFYDREAYSYIGFPGKIDKPSPLELFEYLLTNYYEEAAKSYKDFARYSVKDLDVAMAGIPGISEAHRKLARNIFLTREKEMSQRFHEVNLKRIREGKSTISVDGSKTIDDGELSL